MKAKYDFIQELLTNKKLSQIQRERILLLSAKEIKEDKVLGNFLEVRLNRLEEMIGIKEIYHFKEESKEMKVAVEEQHNVSESLNSNNESRVASNPSLPQKYYYPSGLYSFLYNYNQDPILKSTCHLIDGNELKKIKMYCNTDEYDYNKHYLKISEAYKELEKQFAPSYIKALIRGYLTGKKYSGEELSSGWSEDNIEWNWGNNMLKKWCDLNPGIPPNPDDGIAEQFESIGFKFEEALKIKGNRPIQSFGDLVIHFKKMFHIREDNSLLNILKTQNEFKKWNDKINFQIEKSFFSDKIEIFTDLDKVLQAYNEIIELVIEFEKDEKPIVNLRLLEKGNSIYFSIHHINGEYGKTLIGAKSRLIGQKYAGIIDKLNGICNVYLQAGFGQSMFAKIAIWDDKWNVQSEREEHQILDDFQGGVEHILEFKKK